MSNLKHIIAIVILGTLLAYFYSKGNINTRFFYEVENQLSLLKEQKSRMDKDYYLVKIHKINHYDNVRDTFSNFNINSNILISSLKNIEYNELKESIKSFNSDLNMHSLKFEYLMSHFAIYKNFYNYYSYLLKNTSIEFESIDKNISLDLLRLENLISYKFDEKDYTLLINDLEKSMEKISYEDFSKIDYVLTYIDKYLNSARTLDEIEKDYFTLELDTQLDNIKSEFYKYQGYLEKESLKYHNYMMFIICMLFLWIFYFVVNLNSANKKVRDVLSELNFQKLALDEHSIVSIADIKGNIIYVNDKLCEISGYTKEELIGKNHRVLKSDEHSKEFFYNLWKTISSGKIWKGEVKNKKRGGGYYWVNATIIPFLDSKGNIFKYVSIRTDITEEKKYKEELIESKKIAENSNKAKGEFLANMSHELRTPLNGIIGLSQVVLDNEVDDNQKLYLQKVLESANILLQIINDLLDYSKIEAGKLTIEYSEFSLKQILNTIDELLRIKAIEKELDFIVNLDSNCPSTLIGDSLRISQIIMNIVGNSIKFTSKGQVSLNIMIVEMNEEFVLIEFKVIDTGIGMDENTVKDIFESFTQADASISRKFGGTGLGLTITKNLVESMNGKIKVESKLNEGSEFNILIPFRYKIEEMNNIEMNKKLLDQPEKTLDNIQILLVDDNNINRLVGVSVLEKFGCKVMTANDGLEAVNLLKENQHKFQIILMDIQMPIMNGFKATSVIQKELGLDIPIIAMTASAMENDIEKTINSGMVDHVSKPIDSNTLKAVLLKHLKN